MQLTTRAPRIACALVVALLLGAAPVPLTAAEGEIATTSSIVGKLLLGKRPIEGATVLAYHLATGTTYRSTPSTRSGKFELTGLEHGYYDIAIETADGLFVANQVVNVPPGGEAVARLELIPSAEAAESPREFPGAAEGTAGVAQMVDKPFAKRPVGIVLISFATVGAALAIGGGSSGGNPSPSMPN